MPEPPLLQHAHDLEWLGCELEHYGHQHAMLGFPESGPSWDTFCEKQRGVLVTADKIEHELKNAVRYNPSRLVGVEYPLDETLDSIAALLETVEEIKHCSVFAVQEVPSRVRTFTRMIEQYFQAAGNVPTIAPQVLENGRRRQRAKGDGLQIELSERAPGDFV